MRRKRYTVACLAGGGVGPELMAEASRALAEVSAMHGFSIEELHAPFGGEAVMRHGHALPAETRAAYRRAHAVLVAGTKEPAIEGVKADLDLTWRVQRVRVAPASDLALVSPLVADAAPLAVERAFDLARSRRARITSVGESVEWRRLVERATERHAGMLVEHVPLQRALPLLIEAPERFCVIVAHGEQEVEALSEMAAYGRDSARIVASGRLSQRGPGIFGPTHSSAPDTAGFGIANPSGMLLAVALMLGEGLGERSAARTLERAVAGAIEQGARTPDVAGTGVAATTRGFMDVVLDLLPVVRTDVEFHQEALV